MNGIHLLSTQKRLTQQTDAGSLHFVFRCAGEDERISVNGNQSILFVRQNQDAEASFTYLQQYFLGKPLTSKI